MDVSLGKATRLSLPTSPPTAPTNRRRIGVNNSADGCLVTKQELTVPPDGARIPALDELPTGGAMSSRQWAAFRSWTSRTCGLLQKHARGCEVPLQLYKHVQGRHSWHPDSARWDIIRIWYGWVVEWERLWYDIAGRAALTFLQLPVISSNHYLLDKCHGESGLWWTFSHREHVFRQINHLLNHWHNVEKFNDLDLTDCLCCFIPSTIISHKYFWNCLMGKYNLVAMDRDYPICRDTGESEVYFIFCFPGLCYCWEKLLNIIERNSYPLSFVDSRLILDYDVWPSRH